MDQQTQTPEQDIKTLEDINKALSTTSAAVEMSRITSPLDSVEESLSEFVKDAFKVTQKDWEFNESIQTEILARLSEFNPNQLITLFSNMNVNNNDKLSKLIGPFAQASIAKRQAEMAAIQAGADPAMVTGDPTAAKKAAQGMTREAQQGFAALANLIGQLVVTKPANVIAPETPVSAEVVVEGSSAPTPASVESAATEEPKGGATN